MRVTDMMMFDNAAYGAAQARSRVEVATQQSSSGLRVQQPGDDPAAAGLIAQNVLAAAQTSARQQTMGRASDELSSAEGALSQMTSLITQARTLAVELSNSGYTAAQRSASASQVTGIFDSLIALGNTQVGNRYIFGGDQDGAPPFTAAGAYIGDTNVRQVEIAPGVNQAVSVRADVTLTGAGGGTNVLASLSALATALTTNNVAAVQSSLTALDAATTQIAQAQSQAGSASSMLASAQQASQVQNTDATQQISNLGDADAISAASQLALAQEALNASLTAAAKGFNLTLVNKIQ